MTENEALTILKCEKEHHMDCSIFGEALLVAIPALEEIQQYRSIGTVSECREAVEKQRAKKIIYETEDDREYEDYICPNCKNCLQQRRKGATRITIYKFKHCPDCGQAIDWSDTP